MRLPSADMEIHDKRSEKKEKWGLSGMSILNKGNDMIYNILLLEKKTAESISLVD